MLHILKLTVSGLPQAWLTLEEAVLHYATGQVLWEAGSEIAALHGGHNAITGLRSEVRVNSIIGVNGMGKVNPFDIVPSLSNSKLFQRDRGICGYCGDQFSSRTIPNSTNGWDPALALAPGNDAYLVWNRSYHGLGCAGPGPDPLDGTYFATDASGTWVSSRLTTLVGGTSLTLDPATGELHVLVSDYRRIVYFHRARGADWAHEDLARGGASSPVIRQDPTTGSLLVAYVRDVISIDMETSESHVEVIARR